MYTGREAPTLTKEIVMKSHTTPKRLLKQFSYKHPVEQSDWLWQYSKGKKPNGRKSPTSATRIDGFYADPNDSAIEVEVRRYWLRRSSNQSTTLWMRCAIQGSY